MPHPQLEHRSTRRQLLSAAVVGGAGLALGRSTAAASGSGHGHTARLTVLGTTDLHGHVLNWDYFTDAEYDDQTHNDVGAAKCATLIEGVRRELGAHSCLTLDAGDTIQGTPLAYYYAKIDPITDGATHPMAAAMNRIRYDAAALGNHEFNYGMDVLRAFERQLHHPLLGANALTAGTQRPAFRPYVLKRMHLGHGRTVTVGVLGLVTPGVAIWDKHNVEGKVDFGGIVEQARRFVPQMRARGADVVVVSCHSGTDGTSTYGDALPYPENASTALAQQVPGIDAILVGHAHQEIAQRFVTHEGTGRKVLLSEPYYWGMRVSVMDLDLRRDRHGWRVVDSAATLLDANTAPEDRGVARLVAPAHAKVRAYVNSVIGTATEEMSGAAARYRDVAALDLINRVQAESVKGALAGTEHAEVPVLSIAAPFSRDARIPQGEVTVRDIAGLYTFDNTLLGILFSGKQIRAYLETSAGYFKQVSGTGPFTPDQLTNAVTDQAPNGTPDYNYDVMAGLDAPLTYDIDVSAAPGSRIRDLAYDGSAVADDATFVLAINNYRQSGGGGFPGVTEATVVDDRQQEIRQLMIDWVTQHETIDPSTFATQDWRLVSGSTPVQITD